MSMYAMGDALGLLVVPATPAAAQSCSAGSSGTTTGGYWVRLWCSGAGFVEGYGSTLTDANLQALLLYQVYQTYGMDCTGSSTSTVTGGYRSSLWCSDILFVEGYGSTLSDASTEARELAKLYPLQGRDCTGSSVSTVSGGYRVRLWCSGLHFVDGIGGTVTGAAQNARLAATIG